MTSTSQPAKTPWHLWVIGIVAFLWNGMGAMDYVMTQTQNEAYMAQFSELELAYFYAFPSWAIATWAISVWSAVIGSVLLLFRSRFAVPVFWVALVALFATSLHSIILSEISFSEIAGPFAIIFTAAIFVVTALLVYYAIRQRAAGVLR